MRAPILLLAAALLGACTGDESGPREQTPSNDRTSTSLSTDSAAPAAPEVTDTVFRPTTLMGRAFLLAPLGATTLTGQAQLVSRGEATGADVTLSGAAAGATYEGAVRQGSCARMGSTIASLNPLSADSLGQGRSQSELPLPIDSLAGAPHVLVYGRGGRPESCGEVQPPAPRAP